MTSGTGGPPSRKEAALLAARLQKLSIAWMGAALAVAVSGACLFYYLLNRDIAERLEAIRKDSFPTTFQEINKRYERIASSENAATTLNQAFPKMTRAAAKSGEMPLPFTGGVNIPERLVLPTEEQRARIESLLQTNAYALKLFRAATNYDRCQFQIRDSQPTLETLLPHVAHIRTAGELLALEAWYAAANREDDKSAEALRVLFHLAPLLNEEPLLPARLVEHRVERLGCAALERALSWRPMREPELSAIAKALGRAKGNDTMTLTLCSELVQGEHYLSMSPRDFTQFLLSVEQRDPSSQALMTLFGNVVLRITGQHKRDHSYFVRSVHELLKAGALDWPARFSRLSEVGEQIRAESATVSDPLTPLIYSGMMLPGVVKAMNKDIEHTARMRAAQIAVAIESYRSQHDGNLPVLLNDLKLSPLPPDPFDGQPMRYQRRTKGYSVYSIGPNLEDNDGQEVGSGLSIADDISFTVER